MEEVLFVAGWTGSQELALLEALEECGYGNWAAIGNRLGRSQEECKYHYDNCYVISPSTSELPVVCSRQAPVTPLPSTQSIKQYNLATMDYYGKEIDHYNPLRGEFDVEIDDAAEKRLNGLPMATSSDMQDEEEEMRTSEEEQPDSNCITSLQLAVANSYRWRLEKRQRWKMIIREHGLIDIFRQQGREKLHSPTLRQARTKMRPFLRFLSSVKAEKLIQSFAWETELKDRLNSLLHYRQMGITTLKGAYLYTRLSSQRDKMKERKKQMIKELCKHEERLIRIILSNHHRQLSMSMGPAASKDTTTQQAAPTESRQSGTPLLDISLSPGVDKLTQEEKEFCSKYRLYPEVFLRCKIAMVSEYKKNGKLRLMDARKLCRIDVNKTRKIYDLLKTNGLICR